MLKRLNIISIILLTIPFLTGCLDELPYNPDDKNGETPVEFKFYWPGTGSTRAFDDSTPVKTKFSNGDVIHILGTFKTRTLQSDGSYVYGEMSRYGALYYNEMSGNWEPVSGNTLTWPSISTEGTFKAYYVSGSNGVLTIDRPEFSYSLSDLTPMTDPLEAQSDTNIIYGHSVRLDFSHICANLNLVDLQPMVATKYFFTTNDVKDPETMQPKTFNNAFKIRLGYTTGENPQPTLDFYFIEQPDPEYNGLVYISGNSTLKVSKDQYGNDITTDEVNYFLEPAYYEKFTLSYPSKIHETYDYLSYDYTSIPKESGGVGVKNIEPNLKANTTYTLTVTKSPGVVINIPPPAGGWDEEGRYFDVDVEDFLKHVNTKSEYTVTDPVTGEQVTILESTADGTKLLHNIDFHNFDYSKFKDQDFNPNIQEGAVFDGDLHYIKNLAWPLFRYNYGVIKNVGIKDVNINLVSYESTVKDMSRHGALCMWNRAMAEVSNVRVSNVEMNIKVKSEIDASGDGSETHNIGCVLGSNTGSVTDVFLSGSFKLTVTPYNNNQVNSSVLIGGFVGQNAAGGSVYNLQPYNGNVSIDIVNQCVGEIGSYSVGGIVGESTGDITGAILSNISIDGRQSKGVTSYMGGLAGQLSPPEASTATLNSCIVGGVIRAGATSKFGAINSGNYIGGLVGADLGVAVIDCRSAVDVYACENAVQNVVYATGGAFGRIRQSTTYKFENIIAYGSVLQAPNGGGSGITSYTGNFAGIVPTGQTWDANYSNNNILVRVFGNYGYIGLSQSQ